MYSVMKKNIENSDAPSRIPTTLAPASVLRRKRRKGTRGACERSASTPGAEGLVALGTVAEQGGDDRQCGRRDDRGAQALHGAGGDQLPLIGREAREQGGQGHDEQASHEHAPAAQQVCGAPPEQQE